MKISVLVFVCIVSVIVMSWTYITSDDTSVLLDINERDNGLEIEPPSNPDPLATAQPQVGQASPPMELTPEQRSFVGFLDAERYLDAMDIVEKAKNDRADAARFYILREEIIQQILTLNSSEQYESSIALSSAYLNRYAKDVELLNLLALTRHEVGDYKMSIETYYMVSIVGSEEEIAHMKDGDMAYVIAGIDAAMTSASNWDDLLEVYEHLEHRGMSNPSYLLRQAELAELVASAGQ
jgi:hypothetical protein